MSNYLGDFLLGPNDENQGIYTGNARELAKAIPDESVDLIFTDPPYLKKHLPSYDFAGKEAVRILKSDGFMLIYAGTYWKAETMRRLGAYLDFYFDFIVQNAGNSPIMWTRKIISRHKSILAYYKGVGLPRYNVLSWWRGGGEDKRYHTWGQDESSARYYIDCFSKPGDVVVDFFCGGGTTPYVCKMLGRHWLAFEIDSNDAEQTRERVRNTQPPLFVLEPKQEEMQWID